MFFSEIGLQRWGDSVKNDSLNLGVPFYIASNFKVFYPKIMDFKIRSAAKIFNPTIVGLNILDASTARVANYTISYLFKSGVFFKKSSFAFAKS